MSLLKLSGKQYKEAVVRNCDFINSVKDEILKGPEDRAKADTKSTDKKDK
jgi:hypothetical protein